MSWHQIAQSLAVRHGVSEEAMREIARDVLREIEAQALKNGRCVLRGFGLFQRKDSAQRRARNPALGSDVVIPPRTTLVFSYGRDRIQENQTMTSTGATPQTGSGDAPNSAGERAAGKGRALEFTAHRGRRGGLSFTMQALPKVGALLLTRANEEVTFDGVGMAGMLECTRKSDGSQHLYFPHDLVIVDAVGGSDAGSRP